VATPLVKRRQQVPKPRGSPRTSRQDKPWRGGRDVATRKTCHRDPVGSTLSRQRLASQSEASLALAIGWVIGAGRPHPRSLKQGCILGFGPFLTGAPAHHVNIDQLGKMRHVRFGHDVLDNEDPCRSSRRLPDVGQGLGALCVVPIVRIILRLGVGFGHGFEHVAGHVLASLLKPELPRP
jgi:hypothetical protein